MSSPLKFFDLATKTGKSISGNTWKTRLVLNYKSIPYKTEWTHYPDIASTLSAAGVPPSSKTTPEYTVPAVIDGDEKLSDSAIIVDYLEAKYPEPAVFSHDGSTSVIPSRETQFGYIGAIMQHIVMNVAFIAIPSQIEKCLEGAAAEHFINRVKTGFGVKNIEDMYPEERRESMLLGLEDGLSKLAALVDTVEHGNGWLFGTSATYADFNLVAIFLWLKIAGPDGVWDRIKVLNGGIWEQVYRNCEPYMELA